MSYGVSLNSDIEFLKTSKILHGGIDIPVGTYVAGAKHYSCDFNKYNEIIFNLGSIGATGKESREFVSIKCSWVLFASSGWYCVNTAAGIMTM